VIAMVAGVIMPLEAAERPTAAELLAQYSRALEATQSFTSRAEFVEEIDSAFDRGYNDGSFLASLAGTRIKGTAHRRIVFRTDGKRIHWRQYSWGYFNLRQPNVSETQPIYHSRNWDGRTRYAYTTTVNDPDQVGSASVMPLPKKEQIREFSLRPGALLMGYCSACDERIDVVLRGTRRVSVSSAMENVGGSECYVIRGGTARARCTLWLDPNHGYHPARARIEAERIRPPVTRKDLYELTNVRFERCDGVWVPMEADISREGRLLCRGKRGHDNFKRHYRRTAFVVNPDHDALGSFANPLEHPENDPELKEGARVKR